MKSFTSKCLSWSLIFFCLGVALLLSAGFSGGFEELRNGAINGKKQLNFLGYNLGYFNIGDKEYTGSGESCNITVDGSSKVDSLSIEVGSSNVKVVSSQDSEIKVVGRNIIGSVTAKVDGTECVIENGLGLNSLSFGGSAYSDITIYVPESLHLDDVYIEMGAGELEISDFKAGTIDMDLGAGNTTMTKIVCDKLDVECGAGNVVFTGTIKEAGDFDMAAGNLDMTLDNFGDYNFDIESACGSVKLGGDTYNTIGIDIEKNQDGASSTITVEAAASAVDIR